MGYSKVLTRISQASKLRIGERLRARSFPKRYAEFCDSGVHQPEDSSVLLSAFVRSGGRSLSAVTTGRSAETRSVDLSWAPDVLGISCDPSVQREAIECLNSRGFYQLPVSIPERMLQEITVQLSSVGCTLFGDDPAVHGTRGQVDLSQSPKAEKYEVLSEEVLNCEPVVDLFLDRGLLMIAEAYLGAPPMVDIATAWYSFPTATPSHQAAQLFHFDLERIKWLKAFFYFSDVTIENGPHVFVPGTHRDGGIPRKLLSRGYARLDDDTVATFFPRESWQISDGAKGTVILEDTRGLHKGAQVMSGYRFIGQVQYAKSLFGGPSVLEGDTLATSLLCRRVPVELRRSILPG